MRKSLIYLVYLVFIVVTAVSCKKTVIPSSPGNPSEPPQNTPPPTPPPPPRLTETEPPVLTAVMDSISDNIKGYYEALPVRYDESEHTYPVLIDFHGGGQFGNGTTELYKVLWLGIPKLLSEKRFPPQFIVDDEKWSFIVIAPQLAQKVANVEILNLLKYVRSKYRVDTTRIYMTGFSLGGHQVANYASQRPEYFAAIATFSGLPQIDGDLVSKCQNMVNAKLPIWHFHNRDDAAWAYSEAEEYIRVLDSLRPAIRPRFTTFDVGQGKDHHDCWTRTTDPDYKEDGKNIYEWLLGYKRES